MLVGKHMSHRARPLLALLASLPASFPATSGDWLPVSPTACSGLLSCWPQAMPSGPSLEGTSPAGWARHIGFSGTAGG